MDSATWQYYKINHQQTSRKATRKIEWNSQELYFLYLQELSVLIFNLLRGEKHQAKVQPKFKTAV